MLWSYEYDVAPNIQSLADLPLRVKQQLDAALVSMLLSVQ